MPDIANIDRTNPHSLFRLADGRGLAYSEWGDPQGFPVFYFHGTPSSRLEAAFAHRAASQQGFRLVATDRPGFGHSSFQKGRAFEDWPKDVVALADHLGIGAFGVAGHSGAGPHLFACGAFIPASRLRFIGALGPFGPVASPEIIAGFSPLDRFYLTLSRRLPWLMRLAFAPMGWLARYWPTAFFKVIASLASTTDRHRLEQAEFMTCFQRVEREAFRQGSRGVAHEALLCYTPWTFELSDIQVPTIIWLGTEDAFVPQKMGDYLARHIPGVALHWAGGKGHFNVEDWDNIFTACKTYIKTTE